jgi:hypothetical protein
MVAGVEKRMDLDALAEVYQVLQIRRRKGKRKPKSCRPSPGAVAGGYCVHGYRYSLDRRLARRMKHYHGQQTEEPAITAIIE